PPERLPPTAVPRAPSDRPSSPADGAPPAPGKQSAAPSGEPRPPAASTLSNVQDFISRLVGSAESEAPRPAPHPPGGPISPQAADRPTPPPTAAGPPHPPSTPLPQP